MAFILFFPLQSRASSDSKSDEAQTLPRDDLNENLDKNAVFPYQSPLPKRRIQPQFRKIGGCRISPNRQ